MNIFPAHEVSILKADSTDSELEDWRRLRVQISSYNLLLHAQDS